MLAREIDDDFGISSLTLAEVLVAPARDNRLEVARAALHALDVHELAFPQETAVGLAQLRADTGLKMPDCCVLFAAEHAEAAVASFDGPLIQAAMERNLRALHR